MQQSFLTADDIENFTVAEVLDKLQSETALPSGFTLTIVDTALFIYMLNVNDNIPSIKACIAVHEDHTVAVSLDGKSVSISQFADLFKGPLQRMSELINLMARVKSCSTADSQPRPIKVDINCQIDE